MEIEEKFELIENINYNKLPDLHKAVFDNDLEKAIGLIDSGYDINMLCRADEKDIYPPLLYASDIPIIKLLLEKGAKIKYKRLDGNQYQKINMIEANTRLWEFDKKGEYTTEYYYSMIIGLKLCQLIEIANDKRYKKNLSTEVILSIYNYLHDDCDMVFGLSVDTYKSLYIFLHSKMGNTRGVILDMLYYRLEDPDFIKLVNVLLLNNHDKYELFSLINTYFRELYNPKDGEVSISDFISIPELFKVGFKPKGKTFSKMDIKVKKSITEEEVKLFIKLLDLFYSYNIPFSRRLLMKIILKLDKNKKTIDTESRKRYHKLVYYLLILGYSYELENKKNTRVNLAEIGGETFEIISTYRKYKTEHQKKFVYCYEYFNCNPQLSNEPWDKMEEIYKVSEKLTQLNSNID